MKIKRIDRKNLPVRHPIQTTIVYATALSYWNAPQWLWGVIGLCIFIIWINFIRLLVDGTNEIDIFEDKKENK